MKLIWTLLQPSNLLFLLIIAGLVLMLRGTRKTGAWIAGLGIVLVIAASILPLPGLLLAPLENRFPQPSLPQQVNGIIVLGGAVNPPLTKARGQPALSARAERRTETVRLARLYPEAKIVFSGGFWDDRMLSESDVARQLFEDLGLATNRIIFEEKSTSTVENARFTSDIVQAGDGETWLLVTSASHMPRAMGVFRKQGWDLTPYPVDYSTTHTFIWFGLPSIGRNLADLDYAVRAWAALIVYWVQGYSDEVFPGPDDTS
ncbi:MAG: YdcF family protein [Alphaproteobacteria bacterium]|nr:YdcF family protein [Alphaproteobacteria bacterium]